MNFNFLAQFREAANILHKKDWQSIFMSMLPLVIVTIMGFVLHDFVWHAINSNIAINAGIIGTGLFGSFLILLRLIDIRQDYRVILRFGDEFKTHADTDKLLQESWIKGRYVRHYLVHIARTGGKLSSEMQQSAIENELHALREDYESHMELSQFLVGFMIAMGLLGTFIGLLETLTGISGMLSGIGGGGDVEKQFMSLVGELRKPLEGMGTAFSASMFGLIGSLTLALMMTSLRRDVSRVISVARNVMNSLENTPRPHAVAAVGAPSGQNFGGGGTGSAASSSAIQAMSLSLDAFSDRMDSLVNTLVAHNENSRKLYDLLGVGPRMREINEKSLDTLKKISLSSEEQQKTSNDLLSAIGSLSETQRQLHNKQQQSIQSLIDVSNDMARATFSVLEAQKAARTDFQKTIQISTEGNEEFVRLVSAVVDNQKQSRGELATQIRNLVEQLTEMKDVNVGQARHLNDLRENISRLGDSMSTVDVISSGINRHNTLLNSLLEETRTSQHELLNFVRISQGSGGDVYADQESQPDNT